MKFIKYILLLIYILFFKSLFCAYIPLETSFSDIKSDYKYYNELQELYNKQAIYPDSDGKFNPYSLINRDELVGLTMEISCNKCTKPNTSLDIMNKYKDKNQFYDVYNSNSYLYCISLAHDKSYIDSYSVGYKCDDLTYNKDKIPFCPNNYISLEESLKIILNNTNLFTKEDNDKVINDINSGIITQNLATDVFLKNTDGTPNSYYGYIKKALEYSIEEYDNLGNKKVYKLLELKDGKVYPQQLITKEEFLYMAYIGYKTNSCKNTFTNNLPLKIEIIENGCNSFDSKCDLAKINSDLFKYDFKGYASGSCDLGIDSANGYIWRLYNKTTGDEIIKYDKYINDYTFLKEGIREIYLVVIDKCYNSGEVYNTLYLTNKTILNSLDVSIDVNSIIGSNPLPISFKSIVGGGKGDYSYVWDFGNNEKANGKNVDYIYNESGIYNVLLTVKDSEGNLGSATILLKALSDGNCNEQDSDSDGISDCDDLCQLIYGKSINKGCPVLSVCNSDCSCPSGKKCNTTNEALCSIKGVCIDDNEYNSDEINNLTNTCLEKYSSKKIYGNVVCNTCPCLNFIDFTSTYRICDYLFPAITSTGSTDIFKVGESFEIN